MASTRRILDLLAVDPTIVDGPGALPRPVRGDVRFDACASATAPGSVRAAGRHVLEGFDLAVPAGETHAIVGSTGAGKSTVVKLLLRLYDAQAGRVTLDGVAVDVVPLVELRRAIGYVGQDVFLFQGTVRENLAYGRPDAGDAELERAARLAEAHEFISELPRGYDTVVGERGQKLSGGQRQRLSIARAILKDPPVLVLDEATSAVDNETEAAIQRSLELVGRDRTVIVIAHRLSTVRHADRIHVLEAGPGGRVGHPRRAGVVAGPVRGLVAHPDRRGPRPAVGRHGVAGASMPPRSARRPGAVSREKSPASTRSLRSMAVKRSSSRASRAPMPKPVALTASVALSTMRRPSSVISASLVRRSVGWATRPTRPWCSSRSTMLVTLVGWSISRSPILPRGSAPWRLNASSTSAS